MGAYLKSQVVVIREREPFGLGTPLYRAAEFGRVEIVKYLLEQGVDPLKLDSRELGGYLPSVGIKGHLAVGIALIIHVACGGSVEDLFLSVCTSIIAPKVRRRPTLYCTATGGQVAANTRR